MKTWNSQLNFLAYESRERGEKENEKEHTMAKNKIFREKSFI